MENINIIEKELSYRVVGVFYKIASKYGNQLKERFYQKICIEQFKQNKINFLSHPKINIYSLESDKIIDFFIPDFIIEGKIIVEIKAQSKILDSHTNQLIKYLSISEYEVGYLINFGSPKIDILRRIFTNDRKKFIPNLKNTDCHEKTQIITK